MRFSLTDYLLRPGDYLVALLLLGLGFLVREFIFRAGGSLWGDLRHLFDIEVPKELEAAGHQVRRKPLAPLKRRNCARCGSAMVFNAERCDTCERLAIPPAPFEPAWEPPMDVAPVDFASHATWASARSVPHRVLGPAVLRLKFAMATLLLAAAWNILLSGFAGPEWFRIGLVGSAAINLVLLFFIRQKSATALGLAAMLVAGPAIGEFQDAAFGGLLVAVRAVAFLAVAQALPAVLQLRRAEPRQRRDARPAA
jgi:hypothetical protein